MKKLKNSPWLLYGILGAIIVVTFVIFQPKVASSLFQPKRAMLLETYSTAVKTQSPFNPQTYWEFREFYSPGHFLYEKTGLPKEILSEFLSDSPIPLQQKHFITPFLSFESPYLESIDSLTTANSIDEILDSNRLNSQAIVAKNKHAMLYRYEKDKLFLIFVLSGDEMKKANGFFDYREADKEFVKGKNWLNVTYIQVK